MARNDKQLSFRVPSDIREALEFEANKNRRTLNQEILYRLEQSLDYKNNTLQNIKIYKLSNGKKRYVFGKLVPLFDVDYSNPNLAELRDDIQFCLKVLANSDSLKDRLRFFNKKVFAYMGNNHIDVVDDGVGSLNWVIVEDHLTDEYFELRNKKPTV